jgi:hypothetical protein
MLLIRLFGVGCRGYLASRLSCSSDLMVLCECMSGCRIAAMQEELAVPGPCCSGVAIHSAHCADVECCLRLSSFHSPLLNSDELRIPWRSQKKFPTLAKLREPVRVFYITCGIFADRLRRV